MKEVLCYECHGRRFVFSDHTPNAQKCECETCNGWGVTYLTKYLLQHGWRRVNNDWVMMDVESGELYVNDDGRVQLLDHEYTTIDLLKDAGVKEIESLIKSGI